MCFYFSDILLGIDCRLCSLKDMHSCRSVCIAQAHTTVRNILVSYIFVCVPQFNIRSKFASWYMDALCRLSVSNKYIFIIRQCINSLENVTTVVQYALQISTTNTYRLCGEGGVMAGTWFYAKVKSVVPEFILLHDENKLHEHCTEWINVV